MPILLRPQSWGAHLLMLLAVAAAIALGLWQYTSWSHHRAAAERSLVDKPAVPLASLMGGDSPFPGGSVGQPVRLSGTWLPDDSLYVSHHRHAGHKGYWVVTPVLIGHSAIPVVRGFSTSTSVATPHGAVRITGWLEPSEEQGLPDTDQHDDVITSMRIASMTQLVKTDLYSAYVVGKDISTGRGPLVALGPTQQPDVSGFTGLRNLLYAFQWWIFAGFAVFVWGRWCYDQLHPPGPESDDENAGNDENAEHPGAPAAQTQVPSGG